MCNIYDTVDPEGIQQRLQFEPPHEEYRPTIGPLGRAPFVKAQGVVIVGQWGLTPSLSPTLKPATPQGKELSTNNARRETMAKAYTFGASWKAGRRCLIPAWAFYEPYWAPGAQKSVRWGFRRSDAEPWMLAGLWNDWVSKETGEVHPTFTMLTQNCDAHPLLRLFHKPVLDKQGLPHGEQDKRTVVPVERGSWDRWLHGSVEAAEELIVLPSPDLFEHSPKDAAFAEMRLPF